MELYRENSKEKALRRRRIRDVLLWVLLVLFIVCAFGFSAISRGMREQGALSIRQTILNACEQCYAVEGAYPPSLSYLEQKYGIRVNEDEYVITYVAFASNLQPTVTVAAR